jgi:hypothetical protein
MAEGNPSKRRRVDDFRYRLAHQRKELPHARFPEEGLVILDEELAELKIECGHVRADSINVGCYFADCCHASPEGPEDS